VKAIYTLADLKDWRKAGGSAKPPIRLGVIGQPVAHSLSPEMQNAALAESKLKMGYARFEIAPDELQAALECLPRLDFVGANLTVPHKVAALALIREVDDSAREIGAVNTIKIEDGGCAASTRMEKDSRARFGKSLQSICAICEFSFSVRAAQHAQLRGNARRKIASGS